MSISAKNRERKNKDVYFNKMIGVYKKEIDMGKKIGDLDFDIFEDRRDYFISFIKNYINIKKKIGFEL